MTSAEIVAEFVRSRPALELAVRRITGDAFKAPEVIPRLVRGEIMDAFRDVTAEEITQLDRMRGNGDVDWSEVARAFGGP
jgi:hypothetical protein